MILSIHARFIRECNPIVSMFPRFLFLRRRDPDVVVIKDSLMSYSSYIAFSSPAGGRRRTITTLEARLRRLSDALIIRLFIYII